MMTAAQMYSYVRSVKLYSASLTWLLFMLLVAVPLSFILLFTDWKYGGIWDEVLWQSSLQNGSFWLLPGHVIFQDSTLAGGEEAPFLSTVILVSIFLIPAALAAAIVYRLAAFVIKWLVFRQKLAASTNHLSSTKSPLLAKLLPDLFDEPSIELDKFEVVLRGRSLVLQTEIQTSLPPLFFDSVSNDVAWREGSRVVFSKDHELVFDGTTLEHFRIYAHSSNHTQLSHFFKTEMLSVIVKELDKAEIILENGTLSVVVNVRSLKSAKDIETLCSSITVLHRLFQDATASGMHMQSPEISHVDAVVRFLGIRVIGRAWVQVIMFMVVGVYVSATVAAGGKALTGDLLMPVWLAVSFQLVGFHRNAKHAISLQRSRGILKPKFEGLWSISRGLLWK